MYDYIIVTQLPAFYKINLYNELAKKCSLHVVFVASSTEEKRGPDFSGVTDARFSYEVLSRSALQKRSIGRNLLRLSALLAAQEYRMVLLPGWDFPEFWWCWFLVSPSKIALALESTLVESTVRGVMGAVKRLFLSRVSRVFASGRQHVALARALGYRGPVLVTKGVGIIKKRHFSTPRHKYMRRFLFIGRLVEVKNLPFLFEVFSRLPDCTLTVCGDGPLRSQLEAMAPGNVSFIGSLANAEVFAAICRHDFTVLPSTSETWGLVVEESLHCHIPVIVSRSCGVTELVESGVNGLVVDPTDVDGTVDQIRAVSDEVYCRLLDNVANFELDKKDARQVDIYLSH